MCRMHGGSSPQARAAAARRKAEAEATAALEVIWNPDAAPVTDPVSALQSLAGKLQHAVDVLGAHVDAGGLDGPTALAWTKVMRELRQALESMERLGLHERQVRVSEQTGQLLAGVVRAVLERLQLNDDQVMLAREVVPEELRRLGSGPVVAGEVG